MFLEVFQDWLHVSKAGHFKGKFTTAQSNFPARPSWTVVEKICREWSSLQPDSKVKQQNRRSSALSIGPLAIQKVDDLFARQLFYHCTNLVSLHTKNAPQEQTFGVCEICFYRQNAHFVALSSASKHCWLVGVWCPFSAQIRLNQRRNQTTVRYKLSIICCNVI